MSTEYLRNQTFLNEKTFQPAQFVRVSLKIASLKRLLLTPSHKLWILRFRMFVQHDTCLI